MSPLYSMPSNADVHRVAAVQEASAAVSAIQCAVDLLRSRASPGHERGLLRAIDDELVRVHRLVERLARC